MSKALFAKVVGILAVEGGGKGPVVDWLACWR